MSVTRIKSGAGSAAKRWPPPTGSIRTSLSFQPMANVAWLIGSMIISPSGVGMASPVTLLSAAGAVVSANNRLIDRANFSQSAARHSAVRWGTIRLNLDLRMPDPDLTRNQIQIKNRLNVWALNV